MGNGRVRFRHSTDVAGTRSLAEYLARNVPEARYITGGNMRASHVRPGKREPRVLQTERSVRVLHQQSGAMQFLFVFPEADVDLATLTRRVTAALERQRTRGGAGQSSKDDIPIPDRIRRLQMAPHAPAATAPPVAAESLFPAAALTAAPSSGSTGTPHRPASAPEIPRVPEKRMLRWWHEAYERLLALDPSGKQLQFPVGSIAETLRQWYPDERDARTLIFGLKRLGFVSLDPEAHTGRPGRERVAYVHRVTGYTIVERERKHREAGAGAAASPPAHHGSAASLGEIMDELQILLAKAKKQRCTVSMTEESIVVTRSDRLVLTQKRS